MNPSSTHRAGRVIWLLTLLSLAAALLPVAPAEAAPPPLPPEIRERARLLESAVHDESDVPPDVPDGDRPSDPSAPDAQLRSDRDRVRQLQAQATGRTESLLRKAGGALARAIDSLAARSTNPADGHIAASLADLARAVDNLGRAQRVSDRTRQRKDIRRVRFDVAAHTGQLVEPILAQAESVSQAPAVLAARASFDRALDLLANGDANGATAGFNNTFADASSSVRFDVETFEQNVRDT